MNEGLFCAILMAGLFGYPGVRVFVLRVGRTIQEIAGALEDRL